MKILHSAAQMRAWSRDRRGQGLSIGCVPTMGGLHEGHASLMKESARRNDVTVISIFVNPTQFGPNEDFDRFPRTFEADVKIAEEAGVDAIYLPDAKEMYPEGYATYVNVGGVSGGVSEGLCGASRPGHFQGVATVVVKLFHAMKPDRAYFGQKDAQQFAVLKRMAADLDFGIEMVEMPIARAEDGLALSSRNKCLVGNERDRALCLSKALFKARDILEAGERSVEQIRASILETMVEVDVDYVEFVDAATFKPVERLDGEILIAIAAHVGTTRLIDNLKFNLGETM